MASVFTRPRARPPLAAVSSQQNLIAVSTENELIAALTSLPRSDGSCFGRAINVVADIYLTKTIKLSSIHSGLTITSSSNARINSSANANTALDCALANRVTIENLTIGQNCLSTYFIYPGFYTTVRNITVFDGSSIVGLTLLVAQQGLRILNCACEAASGIRLAVGPTTQIQDAVISGNVKFSGGIAQVSFIRSVISGNTSIGPWTTSPGRETANTSCFGNAFVGRIQIINALSNNVSIFGNSMGGFNITTSATAGGNSIVGNTDVGTISNASTDAVTSNT
jgi:hypothetical protein